MVVDTWDSQYTLSVDHLSSLRLAPAEESQMLDLGARMTALAEVGELDEAALSSSVLVILDNQSVLHDYLNFLQQYLFDPTINILNDKYYAYFLAIILAPSDWRKRSNFCSRSNSNFFLVC